MEIALIFIGIAILGFLGFLIYKSGQKPEGDAFKDKIILDLVENLRREIQDTGSKSRLETQQRLDKILDQIIKNENSSRESIHHQLTESAKIVREVTNKLTKLDETNKQVVSFAEQMSSLEKILKNPKHRGVLGEYFLETMLDSVLGQGLYKMQYKFENGDLVDAVIFLKDQIIPIDSKFSLEKYNQIMEETDAAKKETLEKEFRSDVKKRIDETSKYVRPGEKTTEFAFMYIPAEGVFHSLLSNTVGININTQNLIEYAFSKKVIIVSPSSFIAYLQTVLQGLKQLKMEQNFQEMRKYLIELSRHILSFDEKMKKMGGHLGTTVSMYNQSYGEFRKINRDFTKITEGEVKNDIEVLTLDKPQIE